MARALLEVADVFGRFAASYLLECPTSPQQRRVIRKMQACRTAALGGHLERCDACQHERNAYNSCRDRHCNKCQSLPRAHWVEQRTADILPVPYFHLVFTLPAFLRAVAFQNQAVVYNILFQAVATTLQKMAADPTHLGARIGFFAVLHTWTQKLEYHPHIHCVVPGGGISPDGESWVPSNPKFFLDVKVLSEMFRGAFMDALRDAYREGKFSWHGPLQGLQDPAIFNRYIQPAWKHKWVVYAKPPFAGPEELVDYVGRYTHRIALSNHRLVRMDDKTVTFTYRNRDRQTEEELTLPGHKFVQRFLYHVLPPRFVRLRHYGFLSNSCRTEQLELCRRLLQVPLPVPIPDFPLIGPVDWKVRAAALTGSNIDECPMCKTGLMRNVETIPPRRRTPPPTIPSGAIQKLDSS